jgi:glycosyltransferase involved in cell wall biosynthesis
LAGNDDPKVTVITATYNWSSVLRYAIQSVQWQTFQDWELWVIGDACTDDSGEVVASFNDPRLHWYNRVENSGSQSLPNNDGLARARGKYIAYLGHDDLWYPTHLEMLVQSLEQADADLAYAVTELIGPVGSGLRCVTGIKADRPTQPNVVPSSILHRRDVVNHVGSWKDYRTLHEAPDIEFIGRVCAFRQRIIGTAQLTVFKFPSAWRVNSYRERRSEEQAEYARRIQADSDLIAQEMFAIVEAFVLGKASFPKIEVPWDARRGWLVNEYRRIRGLEAKPPLYDPSKEGWFNRRRLLRPGRILLRRILGKLMQIVGKP